jgi:hypothetical protein
LDIVPPSRVARRLLPALQHLAPTPQRVQAMPRLCGKAAHANISPRGGADRPNGGAAKMRTMTPTRFAAAMLLCGMMIAPSAEAHTLKKINDGQVSRTAPNWPSFIAAEKSFFRREGVELEPPMSEMSPTRFNSWWPDRSTWHPRPSTPQSGRSATVATR